MPAATIYKLLTRAEWEAAQAAGVYRGSAHDKRDGFIHFSTAAQLAGTARKYFAGVPGLVLLAVDLEALDKAPSPQPSPARGEGAGRAHGEGVPLSPCGRGDRGEGENLHALRWEPARDGDFFPHLYGGLPLSVVKAATAVPLGADGIPILPDRLQP